MATQTTNYKLTKPATSDKYDVTVFNGNADTIDAQMKANADAVETKEPKITGAATTITGSNLTASRVLVSNSTGKVAVSDITDTELGYLDGVNGNIQTQLDGKLTSDGTAVKATADASGNTITSTYATKNELSTKVTELEDKIKDAGISITGGASTIVSDNLTASRALISDATGKVAVSPVTSTELGYLDGVTSGIQAQLDAKLSASGTAAKATADASGNTITTTYATKTEVGTVQTAATNAQTTANSAQTVATAAQSKADEAYELADTKQNAITVSTAEPTSSDGSDGDFWAIVE